MAEGHTYASYVYFAISYNLIFFTLVSLQKFQETSLEGTKVSIDGTEYELDATGSLPLDLDKLKSGFEIAHDVPSELYLNVKSTGQRLGLAQLDNGYTEEEMKMTWEAQKILDESIQVTASCARVPVFYGHSEAVHIETELEINLDEMISKMQSFPGLKVINSDTEFNPTPLEDAEGKDEVFVGSIRKDLWKENRVNLWVISDNGFV